jgi:hypothetical protein
MVSVYVVCSDCPHCQRESMLNLGLLHDRTGGSVHPILYDIKCAHCERSYTTMDIFLREKSQDEIKAWGNPVTTIQWVETGTPSGHR